MTGAGRARGGGAAPNLARPGGLAQLYINFEHEKRCVNKCFMMEARQKAALAEISDSASVTPDFVKVGQPTKNRPAYQLIQLYSL